MNVNRVGRIAFVFGLLSVAVACDKTPSTVVFLPTDRVFELSHWYGICASGPATAIQTIGARGVDADVGTISVGSASVSYVVGLGIDGDLRRGTKTDYPQLSHGGMKVHLWEDPERTAVVVEGPTGRAHETPVTIWFRFEGTDREAERLAERLAAGSEYCSKSR